MRKDTNMVAADFFLLSLAILFIGLKLTHNIAWSWAWVLAPLWIPFVVFLFVLFYAKFID